jgi:hypothetical protein
VAEGEFQLAHVMLKAKVSVFFPFHCSGVKEVLIDALQMGRSGGKTGRGTMDIPQARYWNGGDTNACEVRGYKVKTRHRAGPV